VLNSLRHRLHRLSWIALLAIFGLALAPTISHALAAASGNSAYTEICTPQGTRLVALDDGGAAKAQPAGPLPPSLGHLDHCPFCGLAGHAPALPPALLVWQLDDGLAHAVPRLFLQAPRALYAWAPAQARAPPRSA
jgi:hypothetical protein